MSLGDGFYVILHASRHAGLILLQGPGMYAELLTGVADILENLLARPIGALIL